MKKAILFLFIFISLFSYMLSCSKNNRKIKEIEITSKQELPRFEDNLELFINKDIEAIFKLKNGEIAACESISSLLQYNLQTYDEKTCIYLVKLAIENNGQICNGMDFSNPIIESCKLNYYELTEYLLSTKAIEDINYPYSQYAPSLFWAMKNNNVELVELLLKNGADPNQETKNSKTYMEEIDNFIERKTISKEKGEKMKSLLIQYGYKY